MMNMFNPWGECHLTWVGLRHNLLSGLLNGRYRQNGIYNNRGGVHIFARIGEILYHLKVNIRAVGIKGTWTGTALPVNQDLLEGLGALWVFYKGVAIKDGRIEVRATDNSKVLVGSSYDIMNVGLIDGLKYVLDIDRALGGILHSVNL